jgi:hypothetical protein
MRTMLTQYIELSRCQLAHKNYLCKTIPEVGPEFERLCRSKTLGSSEYQNNSWTQWQQKPERKI